MVFPSSISISMVKLPPFEPWQSLKWLSTG